MDIRDTSPKATSRGTTNRGTMATLDVAGGATGVGGDGGVPTPRQAQEAERLEQEDKAQGDTTYCNVLRSNKAFLEKKFGAGVKTRREHHADQKADTRVTQFTETLVADVPAPTAGNKRWERIRQIPHQPIPKSSLYASGKDWSNIDLSNFLARLQKESGIPFVDPLFLPTATSNTPRAIRWLKEAFTVESPLLVPLWVRHHWLLAVVTQKHIDFMDSAAGIVKAMEMQDIGAFISEELDNQHRKVRVMAVPQQPPLSNECGLHVALNAVLAAHNFVQVKRPLHQQRIVSYDSLMTYVGMYVEGSIPTSRLLKAIWGQLALNAIPLMTHEDVREQLDAFAARDIRNFKVGWIGYPDSGPTMLEWSGTLRKKERRSWRVAFAENEGTSLV